MYLYVFYRLSLFKAPISIYNNRFEGLEMRELLFHAIFLLFQVHCKVVFQTLSFRHNESRRFLQKYL